MILRRVIEHFRKQEWTAIFLDFVIVVLGVFVGVQVNSLVGDGADRRRERSYLIGLREDFTVISTELEDDAETFADIALQMKFLLDQSRMETPEASTAELNEAARLLIRMEGTPIISSTYATMTGSGDLELIRSKKVKDALTGFFGRADTIRLVGETHEAQLVNVFQPYIIDHLDYTGMLSETRGIYPPAGFSPERVKAALKTEDFRNVVAVKWDISTDLRNIILSALAEAKKVEAALDEEIEAK